MVVPLEILIISNAVLLVVAGILALMMVRASVNFQRSMGDSPAELRYTRRMISLALTLVIIGVIAAGINLFGG